MKRTANLQVFGCQMNKLDAELVRSVLADRGYSFSDDPHDAGLVLFMTCSVREHAENRVHSRLGALKPLRRRNPDLVIGILGCMAQEHVSALFQKHPHLDIVCGTRDFPAIADLVERVRAGEERLVAVDGNERPQVDRRLDQRPAPHRAFLSVMRGCSRYCSYCIVPYVRGEEVSRPAGEIVEEAGRLIRDGVSEITLLGQAVNRYDDGGGTRFSGLLKKVGALPGLKRLHFVTSYPSLVSDDFIEAVRDCRRATRFLHIPAQSGSNRILKRMNRSYSAEEYVDMISRIKGEIPDMEFGSDFIVGFPGESPDDFEATLGLVGRVRFRQSFFFKYSPRPGTIAAKKYRDDVPEETKKKRLSELLALQEKIGLEKNREVIGREVEVLVEGVSKRDKSRYTGRTVSNSIVVFPGCEEMVGRIVRVRVENVTPLTLMSGANPEVVSP